MYYQSSVLALAAFVSSVHAHGAITKVVGSSGPTGQGFLVDQTLARNCTNISPCQQDSTIIRNSEITQNIVNGCGRTEIAGNIDIGEQTENELAAGRVAKAASGDTMAVTIHQVNADGAGPYECDMDMTSNAGTTFVQLEVANNVPGTNGLSQNKEADFTMNVKLPANMNCTGASTGNICTVRCRNNALAGPFGGCFAVQQTGGGGRTNATAAGVDTAQTLSGIEAQIVQNQQDLPAAIAANQAAGSAGGGENAAGLAAVSALNTATAASATAAATTAANTGNTGTTTGTNTNKGGKKGGNNANANANANANTAATNNGGKKNNGKRDGKFIRD